MKRRNFVTGAAVTLSLPNVAGAQGRSVLKFVPQADLTILDPITSVSYVTRNHAMLVFDTLYGVDIDNKPHPQMVAGHQVEQDGLQWTLTLRDGLRFHEAVLNWKCE